MRLTILASIVIIMSASLGFVFVGGPVSQALAGLGMAFSALPLVIGLAWLAKTAPSAA